MELPNVTKQMIGFQRTIFDNTFTLASAMQDSTGNLLHGFLNQFPWITEENRKPLNDSFEFFKSARNDYKKIVDQGFTSWEEQIGNI